MLKINSTIKDLMEQVGKQLVVARGRKLDGFRARRAKKAHKLYAGCKGEKEKHGYTADHPCQERTQWIYMIARSALSLDVSRTVIVRRAIQLYQEYLFEMVASHKGKGDKALLEYLDKLELEREALFSVANRVEKLND